MQTSTTACPDVKCPYADNCTDYPTHCSTCKNNTGKRSYYEPAYPWNWGLPSAIQVSTVPCPICGAKGDEQHCLTAHCCDTDRKNGGPGIAHVSCPCPKCRTMV